MSLVEAIERPQARSVEERKASLISTVRERLLQIPETRVSYRLGDPNNITLSYGFSNDKGEKFSLTSEPQSMILEKTNKEWPTAMEFLIIGSSGSHYVSYPEDFSYHESDQKIFTQIDDLLDLAESRIDSFLPNLPENRF